MTASNIFRQYIWLVDTIRRARRITLADLSTRWQTTTLSEGKPLSRTTFNRHRAAIEEIFGIAIDCDADNRYYIVDSNLLKGDTVQQWMLSSLTVSNIVGEARGLHDRILLENIPTEGEMLRQVVEAMQRSLRLNVAYQRYGTADHDSSAQPKTRLLEPYCIKLFRRRWYLLCRKAATFPSDDSTQQSSARHVDHNDLMLLSFDRITSLDITNQSFDIDPSFDAESFFAEYFGVMTDPSIPLTRIVLRAYGNERFALRDLPMHHSQQFLHEEDDHVDFELQLRPTSDFLAHILSRGRWVKVISPAEIAKKIDQLHQESLTPNNQ